jgi:hypothetical protein
MNTNTKITGYRKLTQEEIDLVNEIKSHGERLEFLLVKLVHNPQCDQRWVNIGKTDLQTGLMALVRAVTNPESF